MRIGSYVAFGVGAVGLAGGVAFMLQSSHKRSDADALCTLPGGACDSRYEDKVLSLDSQANTARTLSVVSFAVAGAGIGAGVAMLLLSASGSSYKSTAHAALTPWVGLNSAGVRGTF
jgi:hypothetical protein